MPFGAGATSVLDEAAIMAEAMIRIKIETTDIIAYDLLIFAPP